MSWTMNPGMIVMLAAILISLAAGCFALSKIKMKPAAIGLFAVLSLILGAFFAHLFYSLVRFSYSLYDTNRDMFKGYTFLAFWDGNYMLYGGVFGVVLALAAACKAGQAKLLPAMDALAPWSVITIAGIRFFQSYTGGFYGPILSDELYESSWSAFPWSVADYYDEWHWALYLPVILWAVIMLIVLLKGSKHRTGDKTLLLAGMYASLQVILESLRMDAVLKWGFVRVSQCISALLVLAVMICYFKRSRGGKQWVRILSWVLFFTAVAVCFVMEFVIDGKISRLQFITGEGEYTLRGYAVSAFGCAMIAVSILMMRSQENQLKA